MSSTENSNSNENLSENSNTFLYFAFGSNLNTKRIHVNNPSAKRLGVGLLKDYRLDFGFYSEKWGGSVATIVPDPGEYVYGAIWEIDIKDRDNLDKQEGVERKIYEAFFPYIKDITTNKIIQCRCYQLLSPELPINNTDSNKSIPSKSYLNVIIDGANESKLPENYIKYLNSIKHNNIETNHDSTIQKILL